jgi:hypothetical protein
MARILQREACGVKRKTYNILWYGCGAWKLSRESALVTLLVSGKSGAPAWRTCDGGKNGECDTRWL